MMPYTMDAVLAALVEGVLVDPHDGPVHKSFTKMGITQPVQLLLANDSFVDLMSYDDNGTTKDLDLMQKKRIKYLRNILSEQWKTTPNEQAFYTAVAAISGTVLVDPRPRAVDHNDFVPDVDPVSDIAANHNADADADTDEAADADEVDIVAEVEFDAEADVEPYAEDDTDAVDDDEDEDEDEDDGDGEADDDDDDKDDHQDDHQDDHNDDNGHLALDNLVPDCSIGTATAVLPVPHHIAMTVLTYSTQQI